MHKLASIQLMRAVAAGMVLIGHVIAEAEHYLDVTTAIGRLPWTRGVDIFFVISGFIIALSGRRYFGQLGGTRAFLVRRLIRVVPLYWLFTTLMLLTLVAMPGAVKETGFEAGQIVSSYAFFPVDRADGRVAPILSPGWTLNYEIFFYLLFSVFLTVRWPMGMGLAVATILVLVVIGTSVEPTNAALSVWTNAILIEFAFGILLAEMWLRHGRDVQGSLSKGAMILGVGFALLVGLNIIGGSLPRFVSAGIPALAIVAGPVVFWQGGAASCFPRWSMILGDSSYSLYLSHRFVLRALTVFLVPMLPTNHFGLVIYVSVTCAAATYCGVLVFRHVETPMLTALSRRFLSSPIRSVASAPA